MPAVYTGLDPGVWERSRPVPATPSAHCCLRGESGPVNGHATQSDTQPDTSGKIQETRKRVSQLSRGGGQEKLQEVTSTGQGGVSQEEHCRCWAHRGTSGWLVGTAPSSWMLLGWAAQGWGWESRGCEGWALRVFLLS